MKRTFAALLFGAMAVVLTSVPSASAVVPLGTNLSLHYWSALEWCPGSSVVTSWGLTRGDALAIGTLDANGNVVGGDAAVEIFLERGTAPVTTLAMPGTTDPNTGVGATVTAARPKAKGILNAGTGSTWANGFGLQPELTTNATSGTGTARFGVAVITSATQPLSQALGIAVNVSITSGQCLGTSGPDSTSQLTVGGASSFDATGPSITMQPTAHIVAGSAVSYVSGSFLDGSQNYQTTVEARWSGSDPSKVCDYQVWSDNSHAPAFLVSDVGLATTYRFTQDNGDITATGYTVTDLAIRAMDCAGNWSISGATRLDEPATDRQLGLPDNSTYLVTSDDSSATYVGGSAWTHSTGAAFVGGSDIHATKAGASASFTGTGKTFAWVGERGPGRGSAKVYQDGVLKATVSLFAAANTGPIVAWSAWFPMSSSHTIKVVVVGTTGHPRVDVDGFIVGDSYCC